MSRFAIQLAKATPALPPSKKDGMAILMEVAPELLAAPRATNDETVKAPQGAPVIHGAPGGGYTSTLSGAAGAAPTEPRRRRALPGALAALVVAGAAIGGGIALSRGGADTGGETKAATGTPTGSSSTSIDAPGRTPEVSGVASTTPDAARPVVPPDAPSVTVVPDAAVVIPGAATRPASGPSPTTTPATPHIATPAPSGSQRAPHAPPRTTASHAHPTPTPARDSSAPLDTDSITP